MPTPDTETLAARLRAVERALTDEDTAAEQSLDDSTADRASTDSPPDATQPASHTVPGEANASDPVAGDTDAGDTVTDDMTTREATASDVTASDAIAGDATAVDVATDDPTDSDMAANSATASDVTADETTDAGTQAANRDTATGRCAAEADADVLDRLCRLEAAVQALRAALDGPEAEDAPTRETTNPGGRPGTDDQATAGERLEPPRRVPDGGDWPDDLSPE